MGPQRGWLTCALITEPSGRRPARPSTFPCLRGPWTPKAAWGHGDKWQAEAEPTGPEGLTRSAAMGRPPGEPANGHAPR